MDTPKTPEEQAHDEHMADVKRRFLLVLKLVQQRDNLMKSLRALVKATEAARTTSARQKRALTAARAAIAFGSEALS